MSGSTETPTTNSSLRVYQDPLETWSAKFWRKFNENPWVPLGCAATCGALIMSAAKLRQGKSKEMNHWLRARVALQGLTIVALVSGTMSLRKAREDREHGIESVNPDAGAAEIMRARELERERQKEKEEFEERLRGAERATEEEAGLFVVKGPKVVRRGETAESAASTVPVASPPTTTKSGWWPWGRS